MTMWPHVTDAQMLDVVEGRTPEPAHLARCSGCRDRLAAANAGLALAAAAGVPEPSPLYWDAFRSRVAREVAAAGAPSPRRLGVPGRVLAAAAALAIAAGAVVTRDVGRARPAAAPSSASAVVPAWEPLPEATDTAWELVAVVAPDADAPACPELFECLATLTDEETAALTEGLRQDLPDHGGRS